MTRFTAVNIHSKDTILKLSSAQYNVFGIGKKMKILFTGVLVMATAIITKPGESAFAMLMLLGGWLIMSTALPRKRQEEKLLQKMDGKYPKSRFCFEENEIIVHVGDDARRVPYSTIIAVARDDEYYYLFISRMSAYMFPRVSVEPTRGIDSFIEEKTGLTFINPCSLFRMNFKEISIRIRNLRRIRIRKKGPSL